MYCSDVLAEEAQKLKTQKPNKGRQNFRGIDFFVSIFTTSIAFLDALVHIEKFTVVLLLTTVCMYIPFRTFLSYYGNEAMFCCQLVVTEKPLTDGQDKSQLNDCTSHSQGSL